MASCMQHRYFCGGLDNFVCTQTLSDKPVLPQLHCGRGVSAVQLLTSFACTHNFTAVDKWYSGRYNHLPCLKDTSPKFQAANV
jgi:hypothetical protein